MNQSNCTPKKNKFKHLNMYEREIIERKLLAGATKAEIARVLNRGLLKNSAKQPVKMV